MVRKATEHDVSAIARVFAAAFSASLVHVFGSEVGKSNLPYKGIETIFKLLLAAEPDALFVAVHDENVVGYVFAPTDIRRVWKSLFTKGYWWRFGALLIRREIPFRMRSLGILAHDKLSFIRSATSAHQVYARILSIGVSPDAQGLGIGKGLLLMALSYLEKSKVPTVRLEVRADNWPALTLYDQTGFYEVGRTRDSQGVWVIMCKEFLT